VTVARLLQRNALHVGQYLLWIFRAGPRPVTDREDRRLIVEIGNFQFLSRLRDRPRVFTRKTHGRISLNVDHPLLIAAL